MAKEMGCFRGWGQGFFGILREEREEGEINETPMAEVWVKMKLTSKSD
jgi:hypothetical protein